MSLLRRSLRPRAAAQAAEQAPAAASVPQPRPRAAKPAGPKNELPVLAPVTHATYQAVKARECCASPAAAAAAPATRQPPRRALCLDLGATVLVSEGKFAGEVGLVMGVSGGVATLRRLVSGAQTAVRGAAEPNEFFATPDVRSVSVSSLAPHQPVLYTPSRGTAPPPAAPALFWSYTFATNGGSSFSYELVPVEQVLSMEAHEGRQAAAHAARLQPRLLPGGGVCVRGVDYLPGQHLYVSSDASPSPLETPPPLHAPPADVQPPDYPSPDSARRLRAPHAVVLLLGARVDPRRGLVLRVQRLLRPEEISRERALLDDRLSLVHWDDGAPSTCKPQDVLGRCHVLAPDQAALLPDSLPFSDVFACTAGYEAAIGMATPPPAAAAAAAAFPRAAEALEALEAAIAAHAARPPPFARTLALCAGAGGLSLGLRQAGATDCEVAIEMDALAAQAYALNVPGGQPIVARVEPCLAHILQRDGLGEGARIGGDARRGAAKLSPADVAALRGPFDFLTGGMPCPGYSPMRDANARDGRDMNELLLTWVSYVEALRPRFALSENVPEAMTFEGGQIFRTAVAALLRLGYQVRADVADAGAHETAQHRERMTLWAARGGERLPARLRATTCTRSLAAPLRGLDVLDAICDLAPVGNGGAAPLGEAAAPGFHARRLRAGCSALPTLHEALPLDPFDALRAEMMPPHSAHDYHYLLRGVGTQPYGPRLPEELRWADAPPGKAASQALLHGWLSRREQPWKGAFGRIAAHLPFPTLPAAAPKPGGKVARVLHLTQARVLSVREYARGMGYPDSARFCGSLLDMYHQIGNSVAPPLAAALGWALNAVR